MTEPISPEELREIERVAGVAHPTVEVMPPTVRGFGGAYDGAARLDKQIAGWRPSLQSADLDMLPDKDVLDARARDLQRNDAYVQAGATVHKDSIVGQFFMLNARPRFKGMGRGFDEAWSEEFQEEVEEKFTIWSESPMKWIDAARTNDFTSLIRLAVGVYTFGGEVLATVEWLRDAGREYNTAIQMVDADRLSTPSTMTYDRMIRGGIKVNKFGAPQSAFIRMAHQADWRFDSLGAQTWKEVPWRKPWGRIQVIHLREQMRVDQTRAVSSIVAGLREIAITRKFRDVTLQKAVLAATYAATIESELPPQIAYQQLGAQPGPISGTGDFADWVVDYGAEYLAAVNQYLGAAKNMLVDGVKIPHLFPGQKLNFHTSANPAGVGQEFEHSLLRYIAAALDVSYEELSRDYTKTNYSSARAAMMNTWRAMQNRKRVVADGFANMIYRLWLEEAIQKDDLSTFPASKGDLIYTNGFHNLFFDALCHADWIGAARGQIDELKETQAAVLRIKFGLATHEDELARLGKDWRQVYKQLERERKERDKRHIVLQEDNGVNAASGTPREDENDGTEGQRADG